MKKEKIIKKYDICEVKKAENGYIIKPYYQANEWVVRNMAQLKEMLEKLMN